jgi:putative transcriptional regulator
VSYPSGSLRGRLLVATPPLVDPNFDRSVVLLLEHGEDGALGIILNRPTDASLISVLPDWHEYASAPSVVFSGGPVAPEAVIALARGGYDAAIGWVPVLGEVGTVDVGRDPADLEFALESMRVFVGYAGWAPGQLEVELEQDAWFVVTTRAEDPFSSDPESLWHDVLRRQRGRVAMFANFPADPEVN